MANTLIHPDEAAAVDTLSWVGGVDGHLRLIDQTLLPLEFREIELTEPEQVWEAIRVLRVRGAPAIGVAAAYGVVLGLRAEAKSGHPASGLAASDRPAIDRRVRELTDYLASSRPTAVNLFWALDRMRSVAAAHP